MLAPMLTALDWHIDKSNEAASFEEEWGLSSRKSKTFRLAFFDLNY